MSQNKKNIQLGPVHEALLSCSKAKVKELVNSNPELKKNILLEFIKKFNSITFFSPSPNRDIDRLLFFVISEGEIEVFKYLLDDRNEVNLPTVNVQLALAFAIETNKPDILQLLIEYGADMCKPDAGGRFPLAYAIKHPTIVELILKAGFPVDHIVDIYQDMRALHVAVTANLTVTVMILLKHGANIYTPCRIGLTPLDLALCGNHSEMLNILLDHGANADDGYLTSPIIGAINLDRFDMLRLLIDRGANINEAKVNNVPIAPLHYAVGKWSPKIVKLLLESGASVNIKNNNGNTPLLEATKILGLLFCMRDRCNYINMKQNVEILLEFGGDYNATDPQQYKTAYMYAMSFKSPEILNLFWKHGCFIDQFIEIYPMMPEDIYITTEQDQEKVEHITNQERFIKAVYANDKGTVLDALKKGAEPRGRSVRVKSPIHLVCKRGYLEIAEVLLDKGVPPNIVFEEATPLHLAASNGHEEVCKLLLKHGACFNYTVGGKTPLQCTNLQGIQKLLKSVHMYFKLAKSGKPRLITALTQCAEKDLCKFLMFINSVNRQGLSLIGVALRNNQTGIAQEIMSLRLKYVPIAK